MPGRSSADHFRADGSNVGGLVAERQLHRRMRPLVVLALIADDQPDRQEERDRRDPPAEQVIARHARVLAQPRHTAEQAPAAEPRRARGKLLRPPGW